MPLNADAVLALRLPQQTTRVTDRDLLLFALSAGVVPDPLDPQGLRYGYEEGLQVFPTIFTVLGHPGPWWLDPALRITRHMLVQGAQRLEVLGRLEPGHAVLADNRVLEVVDKGAASGAMVVMERTLRDGDTGALLARMEAVTFCRADGGCGGQTRLSRESPTRPQRAPAPSRCCNRWAYRPRKNVSTSIPTNCRAACASA